MVKNAPQPDLTPQAYSDRCWASAREYVEQVLSGELCVGKLERLAVERFERDCERDDMRLDVDAVERVFRFFSLVRFTKAQWAGQQFVLEGWQAFVLLCVFGFVRVSDGLRRYRLVYIQVARKNGKSELLAGIALYLLCYDGENGPEVYSAATKREQARITLDRARLMVQKEPRLAGMLEAHKFSIACIANDGTFQALASEANSLDGLHPHGIVIDELHAHKSADVWNVLDTAKGARQQPVMAAITTAGADHESICHEQREHVVAVLEQQYADDEYFGFIAELDDGDDWTDPQLYRKGNPNLGVSVTLEDLITACERSRHNQRTQNDFRQKRLNMWVHSASRWLNMERWRECPDVRPDLARRACYGGLDLSSKIDLTAFSLAFPMHPDEYSRYGEIVLRTWCWMPEDRYNHIVLESRLPWKQWRDAGYLDITPGETVDYDYIERTIIEAAAEHSLQAVGVDPYNATQVSNNLIDKHGLQVVEMRQGAFTMNAPCRELERLVTARRLNHGNHPILTWMASQTVTKADDNDNIKPDKKNSHSKIDCVVASAMAIGRAIGDRDKSVSWGSGDDIILL